MKYSLLCAGALLTAAVLLPSAVQAGVIAFDQASNSPYANGGYRGILDSDNGGNGFGNWSFTTNNGGFFTHNEDRSINNRSEQAVNALTQSDSYYFAMWHGGDGMSTATRAITEGLQVGQTFSMYMEHGWVDDGRDVGMRLIDANNAQQLAFYYHGGGSYNIDGASNQKPTHGWTPDGMKLSITLTTAGTYDMSVHFLNDNTTENFTGSLASANGIAGFQLFSGQQHGGWERDFYANKFEVTGAVPEPASLGILTLAAGALLLRRRR